MDGLPRSLIVVNMRLDSAEIGRAHAIAKSGQAVHERSVAACVGPDKACWMMIGPAMPAMLAEACEARTGPTVLVRITGFRSRSGQIRVRLFGDPPSSYFDKRKALVRIEHPVPATGRTDVCVAVPRPGVYAIDVRHDENNNGKTDRQDGGGVSGNPHVSLFDMLFARKPAPGTVQFRVGAGTTIVPVTLMYLQGGSFRPIKDAE